MPTSEPRRRRQRPRPRADRTRPLRLPPQRRLLLERLGDPGRGRPARAPRAGDRRRRSPAARRRRTGRSPGPAGGHAIGARPPLRPLRVPHRRTVRLRPARVGRRRRQAGRLPAVSLDRRARSARHFRVAVVRVSGGAGSARRSGAAGAGAAAAHRGVVRRPRRAPIAAAGAEHTPAPRLGRAVGLGDAGARRVRPQRRTGGRAVGPAGLRTHAQRWTAAQGPLAAWIASWTPDAPRSTARWLPDPALDAIVRASAPVGLAVPSPIACGEAQRWRGGWRASAPLIRRYLAARLIACWPLHYGTGVATALAYGAALLSVLAAEIARRAAAEDRTGSDAGDAAVLAAIAETDRLVVHLAAPDALARGLDAWAVRHLEGGL